MDFNVQLMILLLLAVYAHSQETVTNKVIADVAIVIERVPLATSPHDRNVDGLKTFLQNVLKTLPTGPKYTRIAVAESFSHSQAIRVLCYLDQCTDTLEFTQATSLLRPLNSSDFSTNQFISRTQVDSSLFLQDLGDRMHAPNIVVLIVQHSDLNEGSRPRYQQFDIVITATSYSEKASVRGSRNTRKSTQIAEWQSMDKWLKDILSLMLQLCPHVMEEKPCMFNALKQCVQTVNRYPVMTDSTYQKYCLLQETRSCPNGEIECVEGCEKMLGVWWSPCRVTCGSGLQIGKPTRTRPNLNCPTTWQRPCSSSEPCETSADLSASAASVRGSNGSLLVAAPTEDQEQSVRSMPTWLIAVIATAASLAFILTVVLTAYACNNMPSSRKKKNKRSVTVSRPHHHRRQKNSGHRRSKWKSKARKKPKASHRHHRTRYQRARRHRRHH